MLFLIGFLILSGILLFWISTRQRRSTGLPAGRLIYSDHKQWGKVEAPLYDPTYNLTGKPDFIVESNRGLIPVEVKSGRGRQAPYDSHIYQLAAYCLLIDQTFGIRPEYGILHYSNQDFAVDYTPTLEQSVINLIREIRALGRRRAIDRSHESLNRCQKCGFNAICDQSLS
ncbi:MAG: CRISPR-associated protein Cas4 [Anaerolineales bacterium]